MSRAPTEHLTASTVAESENLRDAVIAEGKSRRMATMLMLLSLVAQQPEPEPARPTVAA